MTSIQPCPRCTQALPNTAVFCRRCGLAIQMLVPQRAMAVPPPMPLMRPRSMGFFPWLAVALTVIAIVALLFSLAGMRLQTMSTPVRSVPVYDTPAPTADFMPATSPTHVSHFSPAFEIPRFEVPTSYQDSREKHRH